jgi:two-component SAPR family response regulator
MIKLRTFGEIELLVDGAVAHAILSQRKALALCICLIASGNTAHQREALMAMFWPELPALRARAALRKALHHIRRSLGNDLLLNRGPHEIVVDRSRVRCDATAFRLAIDEGRDDIAIRLCRGEFLAGFHVDDAPDFDDWLESERYRFAQLALKARLRHGRSSAASLLEAAQIHERCGNRSDAIQAYEQAIVMWSEAEAALRSRKASVQQRINRLRLETTGRRYEGLTEEMSRGIGVTA